jgi:hypothetical protein
MDLDDLITRLEAVSSPQYMLDQAIWEAVVPGGLDAGIDRPPAFTGMIDKAILVVPEGMDWSVVRRTRRPYRGIFSYEAVVWDLREQGFAHGPALALCAAALRARRRLTDQKKVA